MSGGVLFSFSLDSIQGSLAEERQKPGKSKYDYQGIKLSRRLNHKIGSTFNLQSLIVPEFYQDFLSKLSLLATEHPELPLSFQLCGLKALEGVNSEKKTLQLLMFLSDYTDDQSFIIDLLLEKISGRFFHRKEENLGKIGREVIQLIRVFGRYEIRQRYLKSRYSNAKLRDNKKRGAIFAKFLYLKIFQDSTVKELQRRRGYSDHGQRRAVHENHGENETDYELILEENKKVDNRSINEILLEIYKESTENYLKWLKESSESKEKTENTEPTKSTKPTDNNRKEETS